MPDTRLPAPPVTVRLFAGARVAAGAGEVRLVCAADTTVGDVLDRLVSTHPRLADVLPACTFLLDGVRARRQTPLSDGTRGGDVTLDVLPPFSGG